MTMLRNRNTDRDRLADELAGIKAEIKALRAERDIERLKLEKARLVEDNDRKIRETEHKVGLLKTTQDHDVANARRETKLQVREENLAADKERFKAEMDFQREHFQREVDRIEDILGKVLERLPNIDASLNGRLGAGKER